MNQRAGAIAVCCAVAVTCAGLGVAVCRDRAMGSTAWSEPRARSSSEVRPSLDEVPIAAPAPRSQRKVVGAPPATIPRVAGPSDSRSGVGFDEKSLMRQLRRARREDPALAITLAREGNRRFPGSSEAPERASILIHVLAEQGLSSEARGEAEDMVSRCPDSAWVREVEQFTGARRHRNLRVGPNGELHYADPVPPT